MSESKQHSIACEIVEGVTIPDYPALADLAAAYLTAEAQIVNLEEQLETLRSAVERYLELGQVSQRSILYDALGSNPASVLADSYPPDEDVKRAGELARERGWKDIEARSIAASVSSQTGVSSPASQPAVSEGEEDAGAVESHRPGLAASDPRAAHSPSETPAQSPASVHKVGPAEGDPDEGQAQYPGRDDVGGADIPASERDS